MDPAAQRTPAAHGLDGSDVRARQLVGDHADEADLVLCATREHRAAAVSLAPDAAPRSSTQREFARLTAVVAPDELPSDGPAERARARGAGRRASR